MWTYNIWFNDLSKNTTNDHFIKYFAYILFNVHFINYLDIFLPFLQYIWYLLSTTWSQTSQLYMHTIIIEIHKFGWKLRHIILTYCF